MVYIKPRISTYISLSFILLILMTGLILLMTDFTYKRTFPMWLYLVACSLITVVMVLLLVKMMASWRFITAGKDYILIKMPLKKITKAYSLDEILVWEEETVITNKREFKQVTVAFTDKNSIRVSNHEHDSYGDFVSYLKKKAQKQMVKPKKA